MSNADLAVIVLIFQQFGVFLNAGRLADGSFGASAGSSRGLLTTADVPTFVTSYLPLPLFVILYFGFKFTFKTRIVGLDEADFVTGVRELSEDDVEQAPPRNVFERIWRCDSQGRAAAADGLDGCSDGCRGSVATVHSAMQRCRGKC